MMTSEEKLQFYLNLSYPIEIVEDEGAIVASIPDLPGCSTFGENIDDALLSLRETKELWLKGRIDSQQPIPEPSTAEEYSGKFVVRIPKVLHRALDREARKQGISLNQYVLYLLAERHISALPVHVKDSSSRRKEAPQQSGQRKSVMSAPSREAGVESRVRQVSGEIRRKRSEALVSTLREKYGDDFAPGYRGDTLLDTVLEHEGAGSLAEYLKKKRVHRS